MINLIGFGDRKIDVIKAVRAIFQIGLKEAKTLVESAPVLLREGREFSNGMRLGAMDEMFDEQKAILLLREAGAKAEIVSPQDPEVDAMALITNVMTSICPDARSRVAGWVFDRWG